jgi:hypothetical protein
MTNFTEKTWTMIMFNHAVTKLMKSYEKYPPRKMQSDFYDGPMTIERFRKIEAIEAILKKKGIDISEALNQ